jgi:membrane protease YdiL (CAAX protease family)
VATKREPIQEPKAKRGVLAYLKERHDPLTGLLLTIPVFLVYHLGILAIDLRNGVDLVSMLTFELLDRSLLAYVGVTLGYAVAIGVAVFVLRRRGSIKPAELLPVLGESVLLAIIMFFTVGWTTQQIFDMQAGPAAMNPLEKLVMAAGAGFHEELIFRVVLFAGGTLALTKLARLGSGKAAWLAAIVSSLIFSAIHYIGPLGDDFHIVSFTFRFLAGLYLAAVYRFRGFAVAVYTHAIYDVFVFFLA